MPVLVVEFLPLWQIIPLPLCLHFSDASLARVLTVKVGCAGSLNEVIVPSYAGLLFWFSRAQWVPEGMLCPMPP